MAYTKAKIKDLVDGKIDRDADKGTSTVIQPVRGSAIPKAGKRFGGEGAAQGA